MFIIAEKLDFIAKNIVRDGDGHFMIIKGAINQEYITILHIMHLLTEL